MTEKKERRALGRGLSALMADVAMSGGETEQRSASPDILIPIDQIAPNPDQPRRRFDADELADLAASIRARGIIQPLVVRTDPKSPKNYQIVAGERRWRAAQIAQVHEVPAVVRNYDDLEVLEIAIIENIQRSDLNPIEEAAGYRQLMDRFGHTQEKLADALGKSRSHIANLIRLLGLPAVVQSLVIDGRLSAGHARAMITADDPEALANLVIRKGLSVRQTERLAKTKPGRGSTAKNRTHAKDADTRALEADLKAALKMKVSLDHDTNGTGGMLAIKYETMDQLDELCKKLTAVTDASFD